MVDEVGITPAKQALVDVIAAGIPRSPGKGFAHLQLRLIGREPVHFGQFFTYWVERAEGIDPSLLQGYIVRPQISLFHGPDGNILQLADANGLQMVIAAVPIADQAVDTVAFDEAAEEGIPALRLAGKALVMTDAWPALVPTVEMDSIYLVTGIAQRLAQVLKERAQWPLQQ